MHRSLSLFALVVLCAGVSYADQDIYVDDGLSSGWENWSWGTDINFAATDSAEGLSSISLTSTAYSALSLKAETIFGTTYAGLKFDILGDNPDIQFYIQSTTDSAQSVTIPLSAMSTAVNVNTWSTILLDFSALPPSGVPLGSGTWDRLNFQAGGSGATYHLDNIQLVTSIVVTPQFLSAEPLANNIIAVTSVGAVDFSTLSVQLNNKTVAVTGKTTYSPPDTPSKTITYLTLASSLAAGNLTVSAGSTSFIYALPSVAYGSITTGNTKVISPLVYGVNFPKSASYIQTLGVTVSRWGGNAVTAYNPDGDFTNAGNDWYFENRVSDGGNADAWVGWVKGAGSNTMLTIPALDWVAKDSTSYSYPKTVYPDQKAFDPYNPDRGDGLFSNGSVVSPPTDPTLAYKTWNASLAQTWLSGLKNKPDVFFIDNEIEIAHSTHQDMHPNPMSYDEELSRVVTFATAAKAAAPGVAVAAPSTCSWWFYWTSAVGYTDNAAHNNIDFLPWFLAQMKTKSTTAGKRLLDYLDIHYYFQADTSANDAAAKALRLRATRSLWDPEYVDESWVGSDPQNHQPNPTAIWLIPRMQALIAQNYPGTKLSISEWSSTADTDITGGLVTADVLGIFGREGVDSATYWVTPDEKGPVGLAFWLYRGNGVVFPAKSAQVNMADRNQGILGVYAGTNTGKDVSIVIINKDVKPISLYISNIPTGTYFLRHFGGAAGIAKWQTTVKLSATDFLVVPAYTAIFLQQQ